MTNYAIADSRTQWFAMEYPGSRMSLSVETAVAVLHTTETASWPGYRGGASAPHYTAMPDFLKKKLLWRAHFPDEMSSRALRNEAGGVETNTLNCVQVELIGTCDPTKRFSWNGMKAGADYIYWPTAPKWALDAVGAFLKDQHDRHGLVLSAPDFQAYPASYGARGGTNKVRMTFAQWRNFVGVCGHQHVPENSHGDPGDIDIDAIIAAAAPAPRIFSVRHRVAFANMYVYNPAKGSAVDGPTSGVNNIIAVGKSAFRFAPDVIAMNETQRMLTALGLVSGYNLYVARAQGEGGKELAVLLRSTLKILDTEYHHAADGTGEGVFDHPRGVFIVKYMKRGHKVALVDTHMGYIGKADHELDMESGAVRPGIAAQQHAEHAELVVSLVKRLRANGFVVFVTADANSRGIWHLSLPAQLKAAGMKIMRDGVDLIAYDPARIKVSPDVRIVPKEKTGSDSHDAIVINAIERKL
jgi:hypothetical protein